jgi:hypothetical protein
MAACRNAITDPSQALSEYIGALKPTFLWATLVSILPYDRLVTLTATKCNDRAKVTTVPT